ncbi:MAG TPA: Rnf-Nqr domain containing protein [Gammaproteobacteria bacterium]|nr:Rnf-Nqr domain containing protein [Gammaproteobacteria bacterium]
MAELLLIALGAALVNNFVLVQMLGVCPFIGGSQRVESAIGMSLAMGLVLTVAAGATQLVDRYLLRPYELEYLRLFALLLVIGAAVGVIELAIRRFSPLLQRVLGLYVPVVATNCAVLGLALINTAASRSFVAALFYGAGAAVGFGLALMLFAAMRERVALADVPIAFRGAPITFITAGILSLAFMAFAGFARL